MVVKEKETMLVVCFVDQFYSWTFFLKNFDLAKTLLLGLRGMGREILKTFTCLPLDILLEVYLYEIDLLNCANIYCLKDLCNDLKLELRLQLRQRLEKG